MPEETRTATREILSAEMEALIAELVSALRCQHGFQRGCDLAHQPAVSFCQNCLLRDRANSSLVRAAGNKSTVPNHLNAYAEAITAFLAETRRRRTEDISAVRGMHSDEYCNAFIGELDPIDEALARLVEAAEQAQRERDEALEGIGEAIAQRDGSYLGAHLDHSNRCLALAESRLRTAETALREKDLELAETRIAFDDATRLDQSAITLLMVGIESGNAEAVWQAAKDNDWATRSSAARSVVSADPPEETT